MVENATEPGTEAGAGFEPGEKEALFGEQRHIVTMDTGTSSHLEDDVSRARAHRHRLAHTACLCFNIFALGWSYSLLGPTFPDLRLIIDEDLATASWILTSWSFGSLIGSIFGGVAYDRMNKIRIFICVTLCLGVSVAATPWCKHFVAMLVVQIATGIFGSIIKTAIFADVMLVWKEEKGRSYMHAATGSFCVGAIISPFVSAPFMAKRLELPKDPTYESKAGVLVNTLVSLNNSEMRSVDSGHQMTNLSRIGYAALGHGGILDNLKRVNYTEEHNSDLSDIIKSTANKTRDIFSEMVLSTTDQPRQSTTPGEVLGANAALQVYGESQIHVSYFISGVVCLLSAIAFIYVHLKYGSVYTECVETTPDKEGKEPKHKLNKTWTNIFTCILLVTFMVFIMAERAVGQYLMTFLISALHWSKSDGSTASAIFYLMVAAGRFAAVFVVKRMTLPTIYFISLCLVLSGCCLLWTASVYVVTPAVWLAIGVIGLGMAPLFGSILSLMSERVRTLTGTLSSVMSVANAVGGMISPVILGSLMEKVSQMCFVYFMTLDFMLFSACIVFIFVLYGFITRDTK